MTCKDRSGGHEIKGRVGFSTEMEKKRLTQRRKKVATGQSGGITRRREEPEPQKGVKIARLYILLPRPAETFSNPTAEGTLDSHGGKAGGTFPGEG